MSLVKENLRSDVLRSSANCVRAPCHCLGESVIDKFKVTIRCNHDVFRFKISVYDVVTVQVLKH